MTVVLDNANTVFVNGVHAVCLEGPMGEIPKDDYQNYRKVLLIVKEEPKIRSDVVEKRSVANKDILN